jgi:hypothetical protein
VLRLLVPALVASVALAGCGDDETTDAEPLGQSIAGSVAQLAQCRDWNGGDEERKLATIADIREQVNRADSGVEAPALTDDEAMEMFDNACAEDFADGFRLYVLYSRAAGFAPLLRDIEQ